MDTRRILGVAPRGAAPGILRGVRRIALLTVLLASFAAPAAAATIESGPLRGDVDERTGAISFGDVLREAPGRRLAVRTPFGTWDRARSATSVRREGAAILADLVTEGGRAIAVRMAPSGDGVVEVRAASEGAAALAIGFTAREGERYLGFGERSNAVDQRGNDVEVFVGEGPYQPEERPFIAAFAPPQGYHPRDDATYFPIPWLLSSEGYGFLLDNDETSMFRLAGDDAWSVEAPASTIGFRVFAGPTPARALQRYTEALGRQPRVAAPWMLGAWWQPTPGGPPEHEELDAQRREGVPISVVETFLHYLPCGDHYADREKVRARTKAIHDRRAAVLAYFNPMVCTSHPRYGEGTYNTDASGRPYVYRYSTADQFQVSQIDFTSPAGRSFFAALLKEALDDGFDGWMEDFGEYTPEDARSADGTPGTRMHNRYPTLYHAAATEQTPPVANYVRSGFTGTAKHARIVWGGDPTTDWGFDGLESSVRNGLTMGLSGVSTWGSDIGGFFSLGQRRLTPELFKRWIQFGAVSGVMRAKSKGIALPEKARPQVETPDVLPIWRRYARLRTQLLPYLLGADDEYQRTGMPMMRSFALLWPGDRRLSGVEDTFLFGDDLLAAPVIRPGETERAVELPPGVWFDAGPELDFSRSRVVEGGRRVTLPAPIDELPLLVRAGGILPLLPAETETLFGVTSFPRVTLRVLPRGWSAARPFATDRVVSSERRGRRWVLRITGEQSRRYDVEAATSTLRTPFRPCRVVVRRKPRKFTYRDGILRFAVSGKTIRAEVQGRCRKSRH
jgi:sulfoquinovosidase